MTKVDYDERQHAVYAAGRQMSPNALRTWMEAFARHLPETRPLVWLDLGSVKNLAEVIVNGKSLGIAWHDPYRVDLTPSLKPGTNKVTIKVTNAWVNRLIGDAQLGVTQKITFTTFKAYTADSPLQPSGLLGPVRILSSSEK